MRELTIRFRDGLYVGFGLAVVIGILLIWLWQPERQVRRHTDDFLRDIETRDWARLSNLIGNDYTDQWGDDRALVLARLHEIFRLVQSARINAIDPVVFVNNGKGIWRSEIRIEGNGEVIVLIKDQINSLSTPFELQWRRLSGKPWDWKLVRVSNPELAIPASLE